MTCMSSSNPSRCHLLTLSSFSKYPCSLIHTFRITLGTLVGIHQLVRFLGLRLCFAFPSFNLLSLIRMVDRFYTLFFIDGAIFPPRSYPSVTTHTSSFPPLLFTRRLIILHSASSLNNGILLPSLLQSHPHVLDLDTRRVRSSRFFKYNAAGASHRRQIYAVWLDFKATAVPFSCRWLRNGG